jgi:peptidoglycan/LPS O-acetylase OafA/YrhL
MKKLMFAVIVMLALCIMQIQVMAQNTTASDIKNNFLAPILILGLVILGILVAVHSFFTKNIAEFAVTFIIVIFIILFVTML